MYKVGYGLGVQSGEVIAAFAATPATLHTIGPYRPLLEHRRLVCYADRRFGNRFKAFLRNDVVAGQAHSVGVVVEPLKGGIDLRHGLPSSGRQCQITIAFNSNGVAFTGFLIELNVAWFPIGHESGRLGGQTIGARNIVLPLRQKRLTLLGQPFRIVKILVALGDGSF